MAGHLAGTLFINHAAHSRAENLKTLEKFDQERQPIFKIFDIFRVKIHVQKIPENLAFFLNRGRGQGHGSKVRIWS